MEPCPHEGQACQKEFEHLSWPGAASGPSHPAAWDGACGARGRPPFGSAGPLFVLLLTHFWQVLENSAGQFRGRVADPFWVHFFIF